MAGQPLGREFTTALARTALVGKSPERHPAGITESLMGNGSRRSN